MKKKFIKEPIFESYCWFVCDCNLEELNKWLKIKFNYQTKKRTGDIKGRTIYTYNQKTNAENWIVWVKNEENLTTLGHELIHLCCWILEYQNIEISKNTEEVFALLWTFYFKECLKFLSKK